MRSLTTSIALMLSILASAASAQTVFFTDEAAFLAAAPPTELESFEDLPPDNAFVTDRIVTGGFEILAINGDLGVWDFDSGNGTHATDGAQYVHEQSSSSIEFDLAAPTTAFGLTVTDLEDCPRGCGGPIELQTNNGDSFVFLSGVGTNGSELFVGVVSEDSPFLTVTIAGRSGKDAAGFDGVHYASEASSPELTLTGTCPGVVDLEITGVTPFGQVALLRAVAEGTAVLQAGSCAGTEIGLEDPVLVGVVGVDGVGSFSAAPDVPVRLCGSLLQAIDLTTCQPSNVTDIPAEGSWYDSYDFAAEQVAAYWPFDGDSVDKSGNGHTGSWNGGGHDTGVFAEGYSFTPGVYYEVAAPAELQSFEALTMAAWFKSAAFPSDNESLLGIGLDGGGSSHYYLFVLSDGGFTLSAVNENLEGVGTPHYYYSDSFIDEWHHLAVTFDGTVSRAYFDGVLVAEGPASGRLVADSGESFYINRHVWVGGSATRMTGVIDEAVVFDRALDASEILLLATDSDADGIADFWFR